MPSLRNVGCQLTPRSREMAERMAIEEGKKRKRAEKFGTGLPPQLESNGSNGTSQVDPVRRLLVL